MSQIRDKSRHKLNMFLLLLKDLVLILAQGFIWQRLKDFRVLETRLNVLFCLFWLHSSSCSSRECQSHIGHTWTFTPAVWNYRGNTPSGLAFGKVSLASCGLIEALKRNLPLHIVPRLLINSKLAHSSLCHCIQVSNMLVTVEAKTSQLRRVWMTYMTQDNRVQSESLLSLCRKC